MALSAPATNAAGANVALGTASVTTTIIDNDTQTFSLAEGDPTVSEGGADSYTVHLADPIDPGVTVSVNIAITLPGGLGGAEAADSNTWWCPCPVLRQLRVLLVADG